MKNGGTIDGSTAIYGPDRYEPAIGALADPLAGPTQPFEEWHCDNIPSLHHSVWTPASSSGPARSIFNALLFMRTFALIRSPYPNSSVISVLCVASI